MGNIRQKPERICQAFKKTLPERMPQFLKISLVWHAFYTHHHEIYQKSLSLSILKIPLGKIPKGSRSLSDLG